jgi:hypothetical protein
VVGGCPRTGGAARRDLVNPVPPIAAQSFADGWGGHGRTAGVGLRVKSVWTYSADCLLARYALMASLSLSAAARIAFPSSSFASTFLRRVNEVS